MTPAEADLYFLQNAKRMALYGMDMTKVKDGKNQVMFVGVAASGLFLYDNNLRMDSFKWPRIIKISYKAQTFLIKVRPAEVQYTCSQSLLAGVNSVSVSPSLYYAV